jgi:hypothetical protein
VPLLHGALPEHGSGVGFGALRHSQPKVPLLEAAAAVYGAGAAGATGHSRSSQSAPVQPGWHLHSEKGRPRWPRCVTQEPRGGSAPAPHSLGRPEQTALSPLRPVKPGRHQHVPLKHVPRPLASLQPEGHESTAADAASQRPPCQPLSQRHCPSERHTPWPEHWRPLAPTPHVRRSHRSPVYDGAQKHCPEWQTPCSPHPPAHTRSLQSMPVQPSWHAHVPLAEQPPWPEHRVSVHCPRPAHCRLAHAGPPQPRSQRQRPAKQTPWPEQSDAQSCSSCSHAGPVRPGGQWQWPSTHTPVPEQMPALVLWHCLDSHASPA